MCNIFYKLQVMVYYSVGYVAYYMLPQCHTSLVFNTLQYYCLIFEEANRKTGIDFCKCQFFVSLINSLVVYRRVEIWFVKIIVCLKRTCVLCYSCFKKMAVRQWRRFEGKQTWWVEFVDDSVEGITIHRRWTSAVVTCTPTAFEGGSLKLKDLGQRTNAGVRLAPVIIIGLSLGKTH